MSGKPPPPPETPEQILKAARHHLRLALAALRRHPADERIARIVAAIDRVDENILTPLLRGREPKP